MFTGIIEEQGTVKDIRLGASPLLVIDGGPLTAGLKEGDSVAVNGVCLTALDIQGGVFRADVMPETLRKTDLGSLKRGDEVNLELALRVGDRLGGHMVSGHVDTVGKIVKEKREKNARVVSIGLPDEFLEYIAPKGSVAVDGISLTVVDVTPAAFSVSLIPHTLDVTTLGKKRSGSPVNIEVDMTARYVKRLLEFRG